MSFVSLFANSLQQLAIQNQIEALQQQQQQLIQQQMVSSQVLASLNPQLGAQGRVNAHRRIQSQQIPPSPMSMGFGSFSVPGMGFNPGLGGGVGLGVPSDDQQGLPRGHGRRHSVNVLNKTGQSISSFGQDGFDDGFTPPAAFGGHSRQASRADSTWRISAWICFRSGFNTDDGS